MKTKYTYRAKNYVDAPRSPLPAPAFKPFASFGGALVERLQRSPIAAKVQQDMTIKRMHRHAPQTNR